MTDQIESNSIPADDALDQDSPEAHAQRLLNLKQAREQVLGAIDSTIGGAANLSTANPSTAGLSTAGQSGEQRREVSAATIGRMMGLVTLSEFKLVETKIDLLSTRVNALFARLDKITSLLEGTPTGSDLDRIDVQIGALKGLLKEALVDARETRAAQSQERVSESRILSNNE